MRSATLTFTYTLIFISFLLAFTTSNTFAQESDIIIHVKLKSKNATILQPWSSTFLSDRDYPAKMLHPKSFQHLLKEKEETFNPYHFFKRGKPDFLEIHLSPSENVNDALNKLQKHPLVEYAEVDIIGLDLQTIPEYTPNDPSIGLQYNIDNHNMKQAWAITKGDPNMIIGIHDSGFEVEHEDLFNNLKANTLEINGIEGVDDDNNGYIDDFYGYNFSKNSNDLTGSNHGTQVAGNAAATPDNNLGIAGMGFNSKMIYSVRSGLSSIIYLAENGAKIINMSWGSPNAKSLAYEELINYYTEDQDVLFIAASGNSDHDGVLTDYYPASYDNVLSVTAVDQNKNNQNYTKSYKIQVAGTDNSLTTNVGNSYKQRTGTSFAAPTVAGIAALVRTEHPELTAQQVAQLIRYTSDTSFYTIGDNALDKYKFGFGLVDAYKALTEKENVHVVSAYNLEYSKYGSSDINISAGDTIAIWLDFQNILNGNSGAFKAILSSYNDYFIPIKDTAYVGQLNEGQVISNKTFPFLFQIDPNADISENVYFRINLEDETSEYKYLDWQNVELNITLQQYISFNKINGRFRPNGTLGAYNGINYYTSNQLNNYAYYQLTRQAGFILATKDKVSDATYTDLENNIRNQDFQGITPVNRLQSHIEDENYPIVAYDMNYIDGEDNNSIGLKIHQTIFGRNRYYIDRTIFTELEITNKSTTNFDTLFAGLFIDWMMDYTTTSSSTYPNDSSIITFDEERKMVIVKHVNEKKYAAIKILNEGEINLQAIDNKNPSNSIIDITDGFSDEDKIKVVSSGIGTTDIETLPAGNNISSVISLTIPKLEHNETARVGFLIIAADSLPQLYSQADSIVPFANYWLKAPPPEIEGEPFSALAGETIQVRTPALDSLALFKEENGIKVLKQRGYVFDVLIDSIDYYYVQSQGRYVYQGDTLQLQGEVIPVLSVTTPIYACKNTNIIIEPEGCDSYNFYRDQFLTHLVHTGEHLLIEDIQRDTSFYITCKTKSDNQSIKVDVLIDSSFHDFYISSTSSYVDSSITAQFIENEGAETWNWYLDGHKTGETNDITVNPFFENSGISELRLFATNKAGCTYIISKEITVSHDHPTSSMVSILEESKLYPNPTKNGKVHIEVQRNLGMMSFVLYTTDGSLLQKNVPYTVNGTVYTIYLPLNLSNKVVVLKGTSTYGSKTWRISIR